jgi:hypothetical protein
MEIGQFLRPAIALSGVLGRLHGCGLIHKDLKPANVIFLQMCAMVVDRYGWSPTCCFEERESPDDARINLIDQRQVLMRFGVLDFVDPDGINLTDLAVLQ